MYTREQLKEYIETALADNEEFTEVTLIDGYESSFIGLTEYLRAVYNYDLMVEQVVAEDGTELQDAVDYLDYNVLNSVSTFGERSPIIVYPYKSLD